MLPTKDWHKQSLMRTSELLLRQFVVAVQSCSLVLDFCILQTIFSDMGHAGYSLHLILQAHFFSTVRIVLLHVAPLLSSFIACETQGSLALNFVKCMTEPNRMTWIEACPCCQMGFDMRQTNLVYPSMCRDALGDSQDA